MTDELGYEIWLCHECRHVQGEADPDHEHGPLVQGYWIGADPRAGEMPVAEFRELGYLQEVNRRLLHPLGLALVVETLEEFEVIRAVRDDRADLEGIIYAAGTIPEDEKARAARINAEWSRRSAARQARLGYVIQPIEDC